ncbi:MAG: cytochrome P450 [Halieaceae bacterium]|jgi:cytochrome P450|nr:cytochrome P450 [Halieaceae bacterium]
MNNNDATLIANPYPNYQRWRDEQPIWWSDGELKGWILSRYDDVRTILKDSKTFSSQSMGEGETQAMRLPLLTDDPPRHTQLRAVVNKAFTSRTLKKMEVEVAELTAELLDEMRGKTSVDISAEFTSPLPVSVIARMMGIPPERKDDFKRWSDALTGTSEATDLAERMPHIMEMAGYFQSLIPQRRENRGEDLISKVVCAQVDDQTLADQDIVGFCMLLLIAGNETTTNLLSNLLNHLADQPHTWSELRDNPDKIEAAIEETLRFDAPVHWVNRKATRDVEFHGQTVKAGEAVYAFMGSANRDPRHYEDADQFSLNRGRGDHHTFGHGIHFCIGAPLARLEARYAMEELLKRYRSISHTHDANNERTHSTMLRGFHHLWLDLEPA